MKKLFCCFTAAALAASLMAGCAAVGGAPSSAVPTSGDSGQNTTGVVQTVSIILPGPSKEEEFYKAKLEEFEKENPDIKCELMFTPNEADAYGNAVQLMFSSDDAPDIFRISGSFPTNMISSYQKGWLHPLDEFLDEEFKATFPEGSFEQSGGLMVNGEIYGIPFIANEFPAFRPMIFNMDVLNQYGYEEVPATWDELEEMLRTVTEESGGSVYGLAITGKDGAANAFSSLGETIRTTTADLHTTEGNFLFDTTTGKSAAANEGTIAAVEFIKKLNDEGLMVPGWENANGDTVMQYLATGKVAVACGMSHWLPTIKGINPDVNLKAVAPIRRNEQDNGRRYIYASCDPYYGMSATCEYPEATWKVMKYLSSLEFQEEFYGCVGRATVSFREYDDGIMTDYMQENMDNASEYLRLAPHPGNYHKDVTALVAAVQSNLPKPSLGELYALSIANGTDFEQMAREYDEKVDQVVDEQIKILQDKGSDITREDLIFPADWDMDENYIA